MLVLKPGENNKQGSGKKWQGGAASSNSISREELNINV
jgi:hypothetical protein